MHKNGFLCPYIFVSEFWYHTSHLQLSFTHHTLHYFALGYNKSMPNYYLLKKKTKQNKTKQNIQEAIQEPLAQYWTCL